MNPLILPSYGLNSIPAVLLQGWLWHQITYEVWYAINQTKPNLSDKTKREFFQALTISVLLNGCTTLALMKHLEKKLDENYTRILHAVKNKSWKQHPTKQQLYGHLLSISQTIQLRWTRHVGYCWKSKDKFISKVLIWIPINETSVVQLAKS